MYQRNSINHILKSLSKSISACLLPVMVDVPVYANLVTWAATYVAKCIDYIIIGRKVYISVFK